MDDHPRRARRSRGTRVGRAGGAGRGRDLRSGAGFRELSPAQALGGGLLVLLLLGTLVIPLRAYAEQRAQLAATRASIVRLEDRRAELEGQMRRYSDESYIREQARIRLGLVEPGETPFRLIDPELGAGPGRAPGEADPAPEQAWWRLLWASIAEPPQPAAPDPGVRDESTSPDRVPRVPDPAAE